MVFLWEVQSEFTTSNGTGCTALPDSYRVLATWWTRDATRMAHLMSSGRQEAAGRSHAILMHGHAVTAW